jgi:hypothetical protein
MSRSSVRRGRDGVNHRHGGSARPDRADGLTEPGHFADADNGLT